MFASIRTLTCLLGFIAVTGQAQAFEIFGTCLFGACKDASGAATELIDPLHYSAEFSVVPTDLEAVEDAVKSASELWRGREAAVAGSAGLLARAKGDYKRILAALYSEGYYGGAISITLDGRQVADIEPGATLPDQTAAVIRVEPGNRFNFGVSEIVNPAPPTTDPGDIVDDPAVHGFARGEIARAGAVRKAGSLARQAWRQQGHPKATVANRQVKAIHPQDRLDVRLHMVPGPRAVYGNIKIDGAGNMDPAFVHWMTGLEAGREFDPDDLAKAKTRLERLGVFSLLRIEEAENLDRNGALPLTVLVQESKRRRIGAGATASSLDGAGLQAFWLHRNLFGSAERLKVTAEVSHIGKTTDLSELEYYLGTTFTKPGVITRDTDLVAEIYGRREFNDTFDDKTVGGSLVLKHLYSNEITLSGGGFIEFGEFDDAFGTRNLFTVGATGTAEFDFRDNKLDATEGYYIALETKPFYEWELGNAGVRTQAEGRAYYALNSDAQTVLAARVKVGSLFGLSISDTPSNLLFLAGGGASVRGYEFNDIGAVGPGGQVVGGRSLFETSFEIRQKFTDTVGVVAFVDAGTVSSSSIIDFSETFRIGVGAGLRYYTSLGPIRLDIAVPIDPRSIDPSIGFYAGIGQAF